MLRLGQILLVLSHILFGIGVGCVITMMLGGMTVLVGNMLKFRAQYIPRSLDPRYLRKDVVPGGQIATTYWDLFEEGLQAGGSSMQFNRDCAC